MTVMEYINSDMFTPVYQNKLPEAKSASISAICKELYYTIKAGEKIFIYGDYDMDGFCCNMVWDEVLSTLYSVVPEHFQYGRRQHTVDSDIVEQVRKSSARVVIICDSGSGREDKTVIDRLRMMGKTPIVIDHHVYAGDYVKDLDHYLMYNAYEERGILGGHEISGAYACLLVASNLCEQYFHRTVSYNAMVYALGSMYSDVVDMSSPVGRALYNAVTLGNMPGPNLFRALNKWNYQFTRRFFSYIIGPKINACFRTETYRLLNRAMATRDRYTLNNLSSEFDSVHGESKNIVSYTIGLFDVEKYGDITFAVHEMNSETAALHVRNFSGLIANQIAKENKCVAVVTIKVGDIYYGSFRDFYNRKMLNTFRAFCKAEGHDQAFGIQFTNITEFRRYLRILSTQLETGSAREYTVLAGSMIKDKDDVETLAMYNEYMNVQPRVDITYRCPYARLVKSTSYRKFYDVGLPYQIQSTNPVIAGSNVLLEPCICSAVELRCVD